MAIGDDLKVYRDELRATRVNVEDLRDKVDYMGDTVKKAQRGLEYVAKVEKQAGDFEKTIQSMKFSLKIAEKVGPMKAVAKVLDRVLDKLGDVAEKVKDKAHDLNQKIKDGQYIEKLKSTKAKLDGYEKNLLLTEHKIYQYEQSADSKIAAFDLVGAPLDPIESGVDTLVRPITAVLGEANAIYDAIEAEIDGVAGFISGFPERLFETAIDVAKAFGSINSSLAFLSGPLNAVYSALKPIEGLLDAIGFIYNITVGPVIDWLLDTLGITKIMDRLADKISDLLPGADILDELEARIDGVFGQIDDFLGDWNLDIGDLIDKITDEVFPGTDADAPGPVRIGTEGDDTLVGRDGVDDVLDPRGGNDLVQAGSGNDVILASAGDDTIDGGAGDADRLIMGDTLLSFSFSRPGDSGPVIFQHAPGTLGTEVAENVEYFVFDNGTFTWDQLRDNVKSLSGGSLTGTAADEVIYALTGSPAVTIDGGAGNDMLTGSEHGDLLEGGTGDDQITGQGGPDTIDGGAGNDTWIFPEIPSNSRSEVDLVTGQTWDGATRDTLISIENIVMQDNRDSDLFGNAVANVITGGAGEDWIDGREGHDSLTGGSGRDLLIGGDGADTLRGGEHFDMLVAGGAIIAGRGELYDGGEGTDLLIYSNNYRDYDIEPRDFTRIDPQPVTEGRVRINAETGMIQRLGATGDTVLATDLALDIERFIGTDNDDTLHGAAYDEEAGYTVIDGGGGDDLLVSHGALTRGGDGDDRMVVLDGGSFDGGGGIDTLDTRQMDARWFIRLTGAIGTTIRAYEVDESDTFTDDSGTTKSLGSTLFSGNLTTTEIIYLGAHEDEVRLEGSERMTIYGGDGDDVLIRDIETDGSGDGYMYGQGGNDWLELETDGGLFGGVGDDTLTINSSGDAAEIMGGDGEDLVIMRRLEDNSAPGTVDGGAGYDVLVLDPSTNIRLSQERMEIDLRTGVVQMLADNGFGIGVEQLDIEVSNFEEVVGSAFRDEITGRDTGERLLGQEGNDTIRGMGARDEIFGGDGNDLLEGGDDDDLLHGGAGNDTLDGGAGVDIASYANAVPRGARGEVEAAEFGAIYAEMASGTVHHAAGTDRLISIEGITGGQAGDSIIGDGQDNVLAGGAGDDTLDGGAGDDVLILGDGDDSVLGGDGDDRIVLGTGRATIDGGAGIDTLDLGYFDGQVSLDLMTGGLSARVSEDRPVWADDGTTADRLIGGVMMSPQDVLETRPLFADDAADLGRDIEDPDGRSEISLVAVAASFLGSFTGFEIYKGGAGNDSLRGTDLSDSMSGGLGNDLLEGGIGDETLQGNEGDDLLRGGAGFDILNGGDGNDTIYGDDGRDRVYMGAGADLFHDNVQGGELGRDSVWAGDGHDTIEGGNASDLFYGMIGDDVIRGRFGNDLIFGGVGFDTLDGGAGNDTVWGGDGRDLAFLGDGADIFHDTPQGGELGRDTVFANQGNDTIQGGNGDDEFHGQVGDDLIFGRLGDDLIFGGIGFDTIDAGLGHDTVHGGDGRDLVYLGIGDDVFFDTGQGGELGRDTVFAGLGNDTVEGGNGDDVFHGIDGHDLMRGRLGNDLIYGGAGFDTLDGGAGNDTIFGGDGQDRVFLGTGNDRFIDSAQGGALGQDTISGGLGADAFVFSAAPSADVITDYQVGIDSLGFTAGLWASRSLSVTGDGVLIDFGAGQSVLLEGLASTSGIAGDVFFV